MKENMSESHHQLLSSESQNNHRSRIPQPLGRKSLQRSQSLKISHEHRMNPKSKTMPIVTSATSNNFQGESGDTFHISSCLDGITGHRRQGRKFSLSNSELASITSTPVPVYDADELYSLKSFGSACSVFSLDAYGANKNSRLTPTPHGLRGRKNVLHCQTSHEIQEEYLTPTQRQARELRHLKALLLKAQKALDAKSNDVVQLGKEVVELRLQKNESMLKPDLNDDGHKTELSPILSKSCDSGQFDQSECSDHCAKDDLDSEVNANVQAEVFAPTSNKNLYEKNNIEEYYRHQLEEIKRQQIQEYQEQKEKYNDKIENLLIKLNEANTRYFDVRSQLDRALERTRKLESQICVLQEERNEQEKRHHQMYLKMYKKGQEAARFEHADEVLEFAHQAPNRTSVPELLQQLHTTEHELERIKNLYRHEIYKKVDGVKDAEVTLRFLKDALYYFLTDKENIGHLQAIESIMGYSEIERMAIERSLISSRHKLFK